MQTARRAGRRAELELSRLFGPMKGQVETLRGWVEKGLVNIEAVFKEHHDKPAAEILDRIRRAVELFTGAEPADDDRTIILVKRVE